MPLADSFDHEVEQTRLQLQRFVSTGKIDAPVIYSSPSQRCRDLCESLFPDVPHNIDNRLLEISRGQWELQPWENIPRKSLDEWAENPESFAPPGGESFNQLKQRCAAFLDELSGADNTVAITHSGVIKTILALTRGWSVQRAMTEQVDFGGVVAVDQVPARHYSK